MDLFLFKKKIVQNDNPILINIFGDSISGGTGLNSSATSDELSIRSRVQKWDNLNDSGFQNLQIPVNAIIKHDGINTNGTNHGLELQLANRVYDNSFGVNKSIYLLKAGNGGSRAYSWRYDLAYIDTNLKPWTDFVRRLNGCLSIINNANCKVYNVISLGTNDALNGNTATFQDNITTVLQNIDNEFNITKTILIKVNPAVNANFVTINSILDGLVSSTIKVVDSSTDNRIDSYHFSYVGQKTLMNKVVDKIIEP